jgi:ABC-2 type transport system ATP-binding protein
MSHPNAIEATGLTKSFGANRVVDELDLTVARGTVFCLLGPNGAGKTTTVRMLSTLTTVDAGQARVAGFDVAGQRSEVRRRISVTGQYAAIDGLLTGEETLRMVGRLLGLRRSKARARAAELLEQFDLVDAAGRRAGTYSGGMKRRLDLAASLISRPEVLFLDEPTTGLDPRSRQEVWATVDDLTASGLSVLLTTQYLEDAERLADRVAVIDHGRLVAEGTSAELKARVGGQRLEITLTEEDAYQAVALVLGARTLRADPSARTLEAATDDSARATRDLLAEVDPAGDRVAHFTIHRPTLDDVFLALTGVSRQPTKELTNV